MNNERWSWIGFLSIIAWHARWYDVVCRVIAALGQRYNMVLGQGIWNYATVGTAASVSLLHGHPFGAGKVVDSTSAFACPSQRYGIASVVAALFFCSGSIRKALFSIGPVIFTTYRSSVLLLSNSIGGLICKFGLVVNDAVYASCYRAFKSIFRDRSVGFALLGTAGLAVAPKFIRSAIVCMETGGIFLATAFRASLPFKIHLLILSRGLVNA